MEHVDRLLTVILVIRDRPFYTFRWMHYANTTKFPFRVLITDGGKDKAVETQLKNKSLYSNVNYEYLRYPYDAGTKEYFSKITDALQKTETPYVILADDDDFWNVEALRASVEFLEKHKEYTTCRGRNFSFTQHQKHTLKTTFKPLATFNISEESASARVLEVYKQQAWTFYDVHRTENYHHIFEKIVMIDMQFLPLVETMVSLMSAARGKAMQLPIPYLIRETGHGQSTSQINDVATQILTKPFHNHLKMMCNEVSREVALHETIDTELFSAALRQKFINFLAPTLLNHLCAYHDISFSEIARSLKTWLIYFFERKCVKLGKFLRACIRSKNQMTAHFTLQHYIKANKKNEVTFSEIQQFLSNYQEEK